MFGTKFALLKWNTLVQCYNTIYSVDFYFRRFDWEIKEILFHNINRRTRVYFNFWFRGWLKKIVASCVHSVLGTSTYSLSFDDRFSTLPVFSICIDTRITRCVTAIRWFGTVHPLFWWRPKLLSFRSPRWERKKSKNRIFLLVRVKTRDENAYMCSCCARRRFSGRNQFWSMKWIYIVHIRVVFCRFRSNMIK